MSVNEPISSKGIVYDPETTKWEPIEGMPALPEAPIEYVPLAQDSFSCDEPTEKFCMKLLNDIERGC